jgi:large subunit ribosomal protein L13
MNTTHTPSLATVTPTWHVVDAKGQRLGRLATKVARLLRGKDKPIYTPFLDTGDYVIVINAREVEVTGKKRSQKLYRRHSGRPGGMKVETFAQLQARLPERIIEEAVWGMLPKNRLGRALFTKLRVYPGPEHPHAAQKPQVLQLEAV